MRKVVMCVLLAACGGKSGPLPLSTEAVYLEEPDGGVVEFRATTEPGAVVEFGYGKAPDGAPEQVVAGPDGKVAFRVPASRVDPSEYYDQQAHKGSRHSSIAGTRVTPTLSRRDHWLQCYGGTTRCSIMVGIDGLEMGSAWEGMVLAWDGHQAVANGNGEAKLPIDLYRYIDQAPLDAIMKTKDSFVAPWFEVPVTVTYEGLELHGNALADARSMQWAIDAHFAAIGAGPVEPEVAPTGQALLVVGLNHGPALLGAAQHVSDVAWIARVERIDRELGGCGTYETLDDGRRVQVMRATTDLRVTIHDRVTGQALAHETFRGTAPSCAAYVRSDMLVGDEREGAVKKWAKRWLAGMAR